jgi:hypothetical protein
MSRKCLCVVRQTHGGHLGDERYLRLVCEGKDCLRVGMNYRIDFREFAVYLWDS